MDADTYYIDYSAGNGSGDAQGANWDVNAPKDHDGRSRARTGFNPREKLGDETVDREGGRHPHWDWLNHLNENVTKHDDEERKLEAERQKRRADARRDAQTFASQLGLTQHQCERVVFLINNLDSLSFGSIAAEGTVLAIISLVANEDGWEIRKPSEVNSDNRGPNTEVSVDEETKEVALFTKIMYDCGISPQSIRHVRKEVREEL